jgi:hypothetical protein
VLLHIYNYDVQSGALFIFVDFPEVDGVRIKLARGFEPLLEIPNASSSSLTTQSFNWIRREIFIWRCM